jgi:tetratricopeptide (TPR) repeat protein
MPPDSGVENGRRQRDEYWMAEFAPSRQWRPVWLQYLTERGVAQSSHGLWMYPSRASDSGNVKYFFPVVERTNVQIGGWYVFAGIAVPQDQAGDFKGLYRVSNETDFPFFMNVSLPADLASFRRCQLLWGGLPPEVNAWATRYWLWPYPQFQVPPVNNIAAQPDSSQEAESRQSALASDPQNPLLRLGLAAALEAKGDRAAALQAYREIIAASPRIFVTYQYLDALLKRQGDLNARIALWRDIAREHPDIPLPYCHLALALEDKQDLEGAIEAYRRAVELGPDAVETLRCLGRLLKGKNDVDGAIDAYQRILEINPADPNATHTLGQLFAQKAAT